MVEHGLCTPFDRPLTLARLCALDARPALQHHRPAARPRARCDPASTRGQKRREQYTDCLIERIGAMNPKKIDLSLA